MYKIIENNSIKEFETYTELVNYLSKHNIRGIGLENTVFDKVKVCDGDVYYHYSWSSTDKQTTGYYPRNIRIVNEDGNNIYDRKLIRDVTCWEYNDDIERKRLGRLYKEKRKTYYSGRFGRIPESAYPSFRRGPWPFVHKPSGGNYYRHPKTTNEKRLSADADYLMFNRGSRGKNLPSLWDDVCREWRNKNWKRQGKHRYQWENGVESREKHAQHTNVYVEEYVDKRYIPIEEYEDLTEESGE